MTPIRRCSVLLLFLTIATSPAAAADAPDPLLVALEGEVQRSMDQLALPDAPRPYFVAYTVLDTHQARATASLGSLLHSGEGRSRPLRAEVRVGSYESDNTNFSTFGDDPSGLSGASLVIDDDAVALARDLWIVTDDAYKSAVEGLATKEAARGPDDEEERPDDLARIEPIVSIDPTPRPTPDLARMEELARHLSGRIPRDPRIVTSRVYTSDTGWRRYLVTSEGTRVVDVDRVTVVRAVAEARAEDGALVKGICSAFLSTDEQRADTAAIEARIDAMLDELLVTAAAPTQDEYIGPVVFSGQASAELFRQLLVPQLMGTPAEESGSDWSTESRPLARLGRRVLPPGYAVVDDPLASPDLVGAFAVDDEGVPAARVQLVDEGVVQSLLMCRVPREDIVGSNGHGRGSPSTRMVGMPGVLSVTPKRGLSDKKLLRLAFKLARQAGQDHVLVVRTLDDPAFRTPTSIRRIRFDDDGGPALTDPLVVTRLYADGREERVRNARLWSADHRVLRDIAGAGAGEVVHDYLAPPVQHGGGGWVSGATSGVPVTLRVPAGVVVAEMEMGLLPGTGGDQPLLTSPLADAESP